MKTDKIPAHLEKHFIMCDDGFYVFWPDTGGGYLGSEHLRLIADELDARNVEQGLLLNEYFYEMRKQEEDLP